MALGEFIQKNVRESVAESTQGVVGKGFLGLGILGIAQSNNKLKETLKLLRDMALFKMAWPAYMLGMFTGIRDVIRSIVRETGSLEAALQRAASIKGFQTQFANLLRSASAAKERVAELMRFSSRSPFNLGSAVTANRSLEILTKGLFSGMDAMTEVGDARLQQAKLGSASTGIKAEGEISALQAAALSRCAFLS